MFHNANNYIILNAVIISAAFLVVLLLQKIKYDKKVAKVLDSKKAIVQQLINSSPNAMVIFDDKNEIYANNKASERVLKKLVTFKNEFKFVAIFARKDETHFEKSIKVDDRFYYVYCDKFYSDVFDGYSIILIDVTSIKIQKQSQASLYNSALHEFKTPISAIKSISELILDKRIIDNEKMLEFIEIIAQENERLLYMLTTFSNDSQFKPSYSSFELEKVFNQLSGVFSKYNKKDIQLQINTNGITQIKQDKQKLIQILSNLLENSYKYTNKGIIILDVIKKDDELTFTISDTGIGISKNDLNSVFEMFYRSKDSGLCDGSGIGLSIVKGLVDVLGGTISISSEKDKGTKVIVVLKEIK